MKEQQGHKPSMPGRGGPWLQTQVEVVQRVCMVSRQSVDCRRH